MRTRVVTLLSHLGSAMALTVLAAAALLAIGHRADLQEAAWYALFVVLALEKLSVTLLRSSGERGQWRVSDWTVPAVGMAHVAVGAAILADLAGARTASSGWVTAAGALLVLLSSLLKRWALRVLGDQWAVNIDSPARLGGTTRALLRTGPYARVRHPIYLAAVLELLGLPLLFGSAAGLALALAIAIPLQVVRARVEERGLHQLFGDAYARYAGEVGGLWPRWGGRRWEGARDDA